MTSSCLSLTPYYTIHVFNNHLCDFLLSSLSNLPTFIYIVLFEGGVEMWPLVIYNTRCIFISSDLHSSDLHLTFISQPLAIFAMRRRGRPPLYQLIVAVCLWSLENFLDQTNNAFVERTCTYRPDIELLLSGLSWVSAAFKSTEPRRSFWNWQNC